MSTFDEPLPGVMVKPLARYEDSRGWLSELFREDELPEGFMPVMAYLSVTHPGIARGPHEHAGQTDGFAFINGAYELYLWENRPGHPAGEMSRGAAQPSYNSKSSLVTPQSGQVQVSGTSSQRVPGAMPSSGRPSASW